jgi:beta-aspartyl-peptidase (threonine type)
MIVVHGGAGAVAPERKDRLRAGVRAAAAAGHQLLQRGGTALDAVVAAVRVLEDDPEFGAGVGSALTRAGNVETCAAVMDGTKRRAGAVAAVPNVKMPVILARAVLEKGEHVILAGPAALEFAAEIGMGAAPPGALVTERAVAQHREAAQLGRAPATAGEGGGVGAVAVDKQGGLAAATSTGGTLYRRPGTVDDAAVPGAGTWADGQVAVSSSGGEAIFRMALAHDIAARVAGGTGLRPAVKQALADLRELTPGCHAGVIVVGKDSWSALHVGPAMPVAWVDIDGLNDSLGFELK